MRFLLSALTLALAAQAQAADVKTALTPAISAVMPQRRLVPPRVRAFTDFLIEQFGDDPPWERGLPG